MRAKFKIQLRKGYDGQDVSVLTKFQNLIETIDHADKTGEKLTKLEIITLRQLERCVRRYQAHADRKLMQKEQETQGKTEPSPVVVVPVPTPPPVSLPVEPVKDTPKGTKKQ